MKLLRSKKVLLITVLFLPIALIVITAAGILWDGKTDCIKKSDVAVVLGYAVKSDRQPSPLLQARLDKAITLYREGLFDRVIVSGGTGKGGYDEARDMKRYLVSKGIPADRIHEDKEGNNTFLTAKNTSLLMNRQGMKSVIVITQYFHITRSKLALRRFGINPVYSAHVNAINGRDSYSILREVAAYYAYFFRSYSN